MRPPDADALSAVLPTHISGREGISTDLSTMCFGNGPHHDGLVLAGRAPVAVPPRAHQDRSLALKAWKRTTAALAADEEMPAAAHPWVAGACTRGHVGTPCLELASRLSYPLEFRNVPRWSEAPKHAGSRLQRHAATSCRFLFRY